MNTHYRVAFLMARQPGAHILSQLDPCLAPVPAMDEPPSIVCTFSRVSPFSSIVRTFS